MFCMIGYFVCSTIESLANAQFKKLNSNNSVSSKSKKMNSIKNKEISMSKTQMKSEAKSDTPTRNSNLKSK